MKRSLLLALSFVACAAQAQTSIDSLLAPLQARSIGPVNMGGRVPAIAVYEKEPRIFFVASASGGVFRTDNGGVTFRPVFENENSVSVGAVAVDPNNPDVLWVGSGESTNRNSVAWGDGVYKTTDGGKTWTNVGLKETMHIGKIVLDPKDPNTVYVAATGHLWGPNPERGVYKTTDGGKTWNLVLKGEYDAGAIDLVMDPSNPHTLLASMYNRRRYAWDYVSGGPGSGLYKTTDGGKNWRPITRGIPSVPLGRIAVDYYRSNPKVLVATVEYKIDPKAEANDKPHRPADNGVVKNYAGGTFMSEDGGESWKRVNFLNPRPWYFSIPRIDPVDRNRIYVPGDNLWISNDGGKTFETADTHVHPDFHAFWIDPKDHMHLIAGCDGGVFESRDEGKTWGMLNNLPIGQFYAVAFDNRKPYWVYGGLQDNGSWGIPTQTTHGGVAFYDSVNVGGGDGFHVQVDPNDWSTLYSESQGGAIARYDLVKGTAQFIRPRGGDDPLRFNWSTPIALSPHNSKTIYIGAQRLFRSVDRGDHWQPISPDLTNNDKTKQNPGRLGVTADRSGAETYGTIITISESPRTPGQIVVGTDDGNVQLTRDGGATWSEIGHNIADVPRGTWCSRVVASKWADGRIYATFDGHRSNDFHSYGYVSEDYGKTWKKLSAALPDEDCLYVLTEGEKNSDLLYLGSEKGLRVSLDRGQTWGRLRGKFPTVAVHDLKVHPRDLDLVIGTHGRSIWTLDVSGLEGLTDYERSKDVSVLKPQNILLLGRISRVQWEGDRVYMSPNSQPSTRIQYFLKSAGKAVKVTISDASGKNATTITGTSNAGLNLVDWNGRIDGRFVEPGDYRVVVNVDGKDYTTSVKVEGVAGYADPAPKGDEDEDGE